MGRRRNPWDVWMSRYKNQTSSICHQYWLPRKQPFICQAVVPKDFTTQEAKRLCAFIETLAVDFKPKEG